MSMGAIGLYFSNLAPISSPGLLIKSLKPIQTDKNLDRYSDRLLAEGLNGVVSFTVIG